MRRARDVLLVTALLLGPVGCHSQHRGAVEPLEDADITLQIVNHHWLDVTVYVIHDGERTRVGLVTASSTQSFALSPRLLGQSHEVWLLGNAVGSRATARTEVLIVRPGQRIEWTLETDLRRSSVGVY